MFGRHSTWQELDIRDMSVAGVGYSWHDCLWQELDIRDMDVWSSQHTAGVRYSWHGCLAVTAHGQELDIRDMDGCGRVGYSWHGRCLVVTAHGRSWKVVTSMSGRHRTWQELKTILVTWIAVVTERDTAGVEYRVNLRCLSHLCSKLLWVSR